MANRLIYLIPLGLVVGGITYWLGVAPAIALAGLLIWFDLKDTDK